MTKSEQIYQGLEYAKNILNSLSVTGIDSCKKLVIAYNNIDALLTMINNGQISINCNTTDTDNTKDTK